MSYIDELSEANYQYYMQDITGFPVLSREQEIDLMEKIRSGDREAYEYFYSCNLKWVVTIAKKYIGHGVALMDIIQAGNIGLMRAMDKYNHKGGYKFSTYSNAWIHQFIGRLLRQKGLVWTPEYIVMQIKKVKQIEAELGEWSPTDERVAELAGITVEHLHDLRRWSMDTVSFEAIVGDEDTDDKALRLESVLSCEKDESEAQREAERSEMREKIDQALKHLTPRERKVLSMRFGLDDQGGQTLAEAGKELGVCRERVRQVEAKALAKLQPLLADVAKRIGATA